MSMQPSKPARKVEVLWGKLTGRSSKHVKQGDTANIGIVSALVASPDCGPDGMEPRVACTNHRLELIILTPRRSGGKWQAQVADTAPHDAGILHCTWSPCGRWFASFVFARV